MRSRVVNQDGYPNEMEARFKIIDECERLGSKRKLCELIGLSDSYLSLVLSWKRRSVHPKIMRYFGWTAIYVYHDETESHQRSLFT
jgi:hypothetical protein